MELTFARSGGFAGIPLALKGTVTFQDKTAWVTSDSGYRRNLTPDEIGTLATAIASLPEKPPEGGASPLRDAYQYDFHIARDGHTQDFTIHGESAPFAGGLVDWVRAECDRIWAHRTGQSGGKDR